MAAYNLQTTGRNAVIPEAIVVTSAVTLAELQTGGFLEDVVQSLGRCRLSGQTSNKNSGQ